MSVDVILPAQRLKSPCPVKVSGALVRLTDYKKANRGDARVVIIDQQFQTELFDGGPDYQEVLDENLKVLVEKGGVIVSVGWDEDVGELYDDNQISRPRKPTLFLPIDIQIEQMGTPAKYRADQLKFLGGKALQQIFSGGLTAAFSFKGLPVSPGAHGNIQIGAMTCHYRALVTAATTGMVLGIAVEYGASDIVVLPSPGKLTRAVVESLVKVAMLRRKGTHPEETEGEVVLRFSADDVVLCGSQELRLTSTEYKLLRHLAGNGARHQHWSDILEKVSGRTKDFGGNYEAFQQHIGNLRKKLRNVTKVIASADRAPFELPAPDDFILNKTGRYWLNPKLSVKLPRSRNPR